jgi:hypothetical protein
MIPSKLCGWFQNLHGHITWVIPKARLWHPNADNVAQRGSRLSNVELLATAYVGRDPASYTEAMKSANVDSWEEACQYEMDALHKNETCELVDLPAYHRWYCECTFRSEWQLGYFNAGIVDYLIHTQTDKLAFTGISWGWRFCFGTQQLFFHQVNLLVI